MAVNQNLVKCLEILNADVEKSKEFASISNDSKKLYDYCISVHPGYTREEFEEFIKTLHNLIQKSEDDKVEISLDNLEHVTGGIGNTDEHVPGTINNLVYTLNQSEFSSQILRDAIQKIS